MATLVLGTIGRAIGGPIGGLVGSLIGGTIDRKLFGGATREGARVANLAVQSAAYGEPLPRLYGRMRVAGNLVWTAGIKESRKRTGGGKSGPATNNYSYSSSFAVIVAARTIVRVDRIWADGKVLRASDGTLNFPATIRTYHGAEDQPVDPLIAAAEGVANAPAYRGRAYVVFEDLPLADYGNRIPNLTFEVVADDAPVAIDTIAVDLGGGLLAAHGVFPTVVGFAAAQAGAIREGLATLATIADLTLGDDGTMLRVGVGRAVTRLAADDLGATDRAAIVAQRHEARGADAVVPDSIWLSYGDPARDYQTGVQAATRRTPALRVERRDLAIAATADDAKKFAESALRRAIAGRSTAKVALPWRYAAVLPGDMIVTAGDDAWRVTHRTITGAVIDLDLERVATQALGGAVADAGRAFVGTDAPQGTTILHLLDIPALPGATPSGVQLLVAASGTSAGWRRADIMVSHDGGESYAVAASVGAPATIGVLLTPLASGTTTRWDRRATVDVELASDGDLQSVTEAAVLAGANLAVVGDEIIQFTSATALGNRRFRVSNMLRGRRGSEAAATSHATGERFVLLDDRVLSIAMPPEALGASLMVKAVGPGDDPVRVQPQTIVPRGVALRPLSPATVTIAMAADGGRTVAWVRRSRAGFAWTDGTDAPIAEDSERYRVTVRGTSGVVRQADVTTSSWTYSAADAAADTSASPLTIDVAQISASVGPGLPTRAAIA